MLNRIKDDCGSEVIDYTVAGAAVSSGQVVILNDLAGVAVTSGEIGETVALEMSGVFQFTSAAGSTALTQGEKVYLVAGSNPQTVTHDAAGNTLIGRCYVDSDMNGATVQVKLFNPVG